MSTKSKLKGHEIEYINNEWVYSDNKKPTATTHKTRACGNCGKPETKEGHDACLGTLPGLMNACCGHGVIDETYIQYFDGSSIHGINASMIIETLKESNR